MLASSGFTAPQMEKNTLRVCMKWSLLDKLSGLEDILSAAPSLNVVTSVLHRNREEVPSSLDLRVSFGVVPALV